MDKAIIGEDRMTSAAWMFRAGWTCFEAGLRWERAVPK